MAKVDGFDDKVEVKAADPLAPLPMPLYYMHSKMPMYNNKFFVGIKSSLNASLALFPGLWSGVRKPWTGFSRWNLRGETVRADRNLAYFAAISDRLF